MPVPISQYVLKVHSRCDLACDHCYVYELADQSWRAKPRAIAPPTAEMAARRISDHAAAHKIPEIFVVLHGGEPLLLGKAGMRALLEVLSANITRVAGLDLRIHSNGMLLDEQWCELFSEHGVQVGISLDGDQSANDRHRKFADGRSSYAQTLAALALLRRPEYRHIYAGILCTIDIANDPVAVYGALAQQEPPNLDLLLPHATWERPPYRPAGRDSPYADWLLRIYRRWDADGRRIPIRILDSLLSAARGGPSFTEALGNDPADLLVIDTNGAWEQPDSMKAAFDGAAATGMNVFDHAVDEVTLHPAVAARQRGIPALCATCRSCPVVRVCGGGLYAHRFRPAARPAAVPAASKDAGAADEFAHPSVYCDDLKALIGGVLAAERIPVLTTTAAIPEPAAGIREYTGPAHVLPPSAFDSLAAGPGDLRAVTVLAAARRSEARALVAMVAASDDSWRDTALRSAASEGWALLCALSRDHPGEVEHVLTHPYTYAWALRCLRPPAGADRDLDRAHLAGLAAAAAFMAGIAADLPLPVRDGYVHLPTVGAFADPDAGPTRVVSIIPGHRPAARGCRWRDGRRVMAPPFRRLAVEDLDPFRDCQDWPAAGRLPQSQWRAWRRGLATAGGELTHQVPAYARVLGAFLRAVVPLRSAPGDERRSATAKQAFGAVALALPGERAGDGALSELLLHEFQHVKLSALLDMHELSNVGYRRRFRVPWRDDPRPVEGVLHGCYAFLALAHLSGAQRAAGRARYLRYRSWVADAANGLLSADGALTEPGRRFVTGVAVAVDSEAG
jgi:uncharacterized protein